MIKTSRYLIIGNSAGGIAAAEAIRQKDKHGGIAIISDESYQAYSRPMISKYLAGRCTLDDMLFRPADFYVKNNIHTLLGRQVAHIDPARRTVQLFNGDAIEYEKLLLATGGKPIVPPIKDNGKGGVFTFTRLEDARLIKEATIAGARRVVVVGGGLIGMSVTEALVGLGLEVSVVELKDRVLSLALDKASSALVEKTLKQNGVKVLTGQSVTGIVRDDNGNVKGVILNTGNEVACNLVVLAIGVVPRSDLAASAGIKVNRGILVDKHMKTSQPEIFACGDVAEAGDALLGINRVLPIWPGAYIGGRVAGMNMAGGNAEYPGWVSHNAFNYFGLAIVSAGTTETEGEQGYEVLTASGKDSYIKVVLKDNRIAGMALSGDIQRAGILFNLMREKINVEHFKKTLVAANFGLVSLPVELRQQVLARPGITDTCLDVFKQPELALTR